VTLQVSDFGGPGVIQQAMQIAGTALALLLVQVNDYAENQRRFLSRSEDSTVSGQWRP
jgi:hypothetical protein